jgi:hypothetical protein
MKPAPLCCVEVAFDGGDALTLHQFDFKKLWDKSYGGYDFRRATMEQSESQFIGDYQILINWEKVTHIRELECGECGPSGTDTYI